VDIKESRDLPKIVAQAPVGKDVDVTVLRQGKEIIKKIRLGRLEDNEKQASLSTKGGPPEKTQATGPVGKALGMEFSGLTEDLRQKFAIKPSVASGVVVTAVDPDSAAAEKRIQPGEVIVEINQEQIKDPAEIAKKMAALKTAGKKSALLLVANGQGEVRFVALALPEK
jgi:serine protease Do